LISQLVDECTDDKRFPQLANTDEDDMIDVNEVVCSKCNKDTYTDTNGNEHDIVLCDRANCFRAYHLDCLDPPIQALDDGTVDEEDWFCWRCETIDDILDHVNDRLGTTYDETNLFPELNKESISVLDSRHLDMDESEDEDYHPDVDGNDEGSANGDTDENEDESSSSDRSDSESFSDGSDSDSNISETEVSGLIAESGGIAASIETGYHTRRRSVQPAPEDFIGRMIAFEDKDKNVSFGDVIEVLQREPSSSSSDVRVIEEKAISKSLTEHMWSVAFDDDVVTVTYKMLDESLRLYDDIESGRVSVRDGRVIRKKVDEAENCDVIDSSNILGYGRSKAKVDYRTLSLQVSYVT
jgi:hypothetical protein